MLNQNIEITANEVLNVGRSEFKYIDENNVEQVRIEETQSISIETEELCTVSVTSVDTVIELTEDVFMMPLDKVKMEGSVKDGFADMGSSGQDGGAQAQQNVVVDVPEPEVVEDEPPKKKSKGMKFLGLLGAACTVVVGVVPVAAGAGIVACAAAMAMSVIAVTGTLIATAQVQEALSDTDENYLEEIMGTESYNTFVSGYYLATELITLKGAKIPVSAKRWILGTGAGIGIIGGRLFDKDGDGDWKYYLRCLDNGLAISSLGYGLTRIPNVVRNYRNNRALRSIASNSDLKIDYRKFTKIFNQFGEELLSVKDFKKFRKLMLEKGVEIVIDSKGKILDGNKVGGFDFEMMKMFFKETPTKHTALHEMFHLEHFLDVGEDAYRTLTVMEKEMYVYNKLFNSGKLNASEIFEAQRYIEKLRTGRWPMSDWKGY